MDMRVAKSAGRLLLRIIEQYVPVATFLAMFVAFNIQIFSRYVLGTPLSWPWDVTVIAFLWTVLLGATRPVRTQEHIKFSLVYNTRSEGTQLAFRIIGNTLLVVTLGIAILPSWDYVYFTKIMRSEVLRVPMIYVFSPFMFFVVLSTAYLFLDLARDLATAYRGLTGKKGGPS